MHKKLATTALAAVAAVGLAAAGSGAALAQKSGGILNFVVGSEAPSYDAHIETTFGTVHPIAPFYSLLVRMNPENLSSSTDIVCDLCEGEVPKPTEDGTRYEFKIRKGVKFHDGTPLTAHDVVASLLKVIAPPEGIASVRKAYYSMVDSVTAPDDFTVVIKLKYPSGAFMPALVQPFNFIYSKKDLDTHGYTWHKTNVNGSGPFMFVQAQPGAFVEGKKNPDYYMKGRPYLDGFKATVAPKEAVRIQALRGGRADIEFRGLPPKSRDDLVNALGDKITVQESDWNCVLLVTINQTRKPFDDARVRRALTLAIDRWGGSKYLSKIAIVKTVGGVAFPGHPLAATKEELEKVPGYWPDIEKSREEAKRLLKEAGAENLKIDMNNRGVDQPYKVVGTWLIDQWKRVGIETTQNVRPSPVFYDTLRKTKDYDVSVDFNCQSVVNPIADVTKFLTSASSYFGGGKDKVQEEIYEKMARAADEAEQRKLMREYEMRTLGEEASTLITLWWYRIIPHHSYVKGWQVSPSHYLGQQLDQVWLDKG